LKNPQIFGVNPPIEDLQLLEGCEAGWTRSDDAPQEMTTGGLIRVVRTTNIAQLWKSANL